MSAALSGLYGRVDEIAKMVPNELNITLKDALGACADFGSRWQETWLNCST
jgi:hypothetical protein